MFVDVKGYDPWSSVLSRSGGVEYLVAIPSRNSASTLPYVIENAYEGLEEFGGSGIIVVVDGLSTDPTREIVGVLKEHYGRDKLFILPNTMSPGKGGAMNLAVRLADKLGVKAMAFLDSDLRSVSPEWVILLLKGALSRGFATPNYVRDRFDATITNFIARPLTTTAYLIDIKQPIGGEFGLGEKLIKYLASEAPWLSIEYNLLFGTDIFITHTALSLGIEPAEAHLGSKIHETKDPGLRLKGMFIEVLGSLYNALIEYSERWTGIRRDNIVEPEAVDEPKPPFIPPPRINVNIDRAFNEYSKIIDEDSKPLLELFFGDEIVEAVEDNIRRGEGLDRDHWAWILLHGFRVFYTKPRYTTRRRLLQIMYHLWQGRLFSYYSEARNMSDEEVQEYIRGEAYSLVENRDRFLEVIT